MCMCSVREVPLPCGFMSTMSAWIIVKRKWRAGKAFMIILVFWCLLILATSLNHHPFFLSQWLDIPQELQLRVLKKKFSNISNSVNNSVTDDLLISQRSLPTFLKFVKSPDIRTEMSGRPHLHVPNAKVTTGSVNCLKLLEGDDREIRYATNVTKKVSLKALPDDVFVNITDDCSLFKKERGYILDAMSQEERTFPIAYSILIYKNVEQLETLLRAIYRPQNAYCIHIDRKAREAVHLGVAAIVRCFSNVFIASKLEDVVYAGFTRLRADLNCMQDLLNYKVPWQYVINLSGEMFPLRTNGEIVKILKIYNGSNDIEGAFWNSPQRWKTKYEVASYSNGYIFMNKTKIPKVAPPHNITVEKGSAYGVFARGFVRYFLTDKIAQDFLKWSKDTLSPDELFWSTLHNIKRNQHLNPPGAYRGDHSKKKWMASYSAWPPGDPCYGFVQRQICIPGARDVHLLRARKELFFNKIVFTKNYMVFECLNEWLDNRTRTVYPFDTVEYRNLAFVKH